MSSDLKQDILDSVHDIDDMLKTYYELFDRVKTKKPDIVEIAALGSVLQSFYNGATQNSARVVGCVKLDCKCWGTTLAAIAALTSPSAHDDGCCPAVVAARRADMESAPTDGGAGAAFAVIGAAAMPSAIASASSDARAFLQWFALYPLLAFFLCEYYSYKA